jgi:hypothetical protein
MATSKFGREPKMMTTEPSADLLKREGMKKGGHAKKMAMGGNPMMVDPRAMAMRKKMAMQPALLTRKNGGKAHMSEGGMGKGVGTVSDYEAKKMSEPVKKAKGGEVESNKEHMAEMKKMSKVEKELKHHESMKASKAHKGLKAGGMYKPQMGGLLSEGKPHSKGMTGGIEGAGYKRGGKADGGGTMKMVPRGGAYLENGGKMAKGGLASKGDAFQTKGTLKPKIDVQDKVVTAKQTKSLNTKSGGVEGVGYKHGGKMHKFAKGGTVSQNVASRYLNDMKDGEKMPNKSGKTGEIKQAPAGYKHGVHVAMTCKAEGGFTVNKKMQKC